MTTRSEIIAQIEMEISRLERARDFLTASLTGLKKDKQAASAIASLKKLKAAPPAPRKRRQPEAATVAVSVAPPAPPASPEPKEEPQVKRVPPRRRMERRHSQADKANRSGAALSGQVPAGPVAVSANEARKVQERAAPAPMPPVVAEPRTEIGGERSLASLIQAFERRAGFGGLETP